tara:strand:- start:2324 stop:3787 length:1464 start_codon:yes stop_codon:yes gene_type:complete
MQNFILKILSNSLNPNILNNIAIEDKNNSLTYKDFSNYIYSASKFLLNNGLAKQDIVINALGNKLEQIILHYATILTGSISVPLSKDVTEEKLNFYVKELNPKLVFVNNKNFNIYKIPIIVITSLNNLIQKFIDSSKTPLVKKDFIVAPNDLVSILYTTGSTGVQKGVKLNHSCVNQALKNIKNYIGYNENNREVIPLPLHHSFGLGHVYSTHLSGGSVYITDGIKSLKEFYNSFKKNYNATALSPSMLKILLSEKLKEKTLSIFENLKYMVVNSEKLPEEITKILIQNCPNLRLMYYYGLTEASRSFFITLSIENEKYYSSVGKPTSNNVKVKIIKDEICIGGNHLFSGYWNDNKTNISNDYFKTGDLGFLDEKGYLFITGRKKDQINVGGLKISSEEIKKALMKIKFVSDAAIVSIENEITGEAPAALIVTSKKITKESIISNLKKDLENFAIPKYIVFNDIIPKSETGKILTPEVIKIINEQKC